MKEFLLTFLDKRINDVAEKHMFVFLKILNPFVKGICQKLGEQCQVFEEKSTN